MFAAVKPARKILNAIANCSVVFGIGLHDCLLLILHLKRIRGKTYS